MSTILKNLLKSKTKLIALLTLVIIGLSLRLFNIGFGLKSQSYFADEPEFVEYAVNYAFNLKSIILQGDYYKLIPVSYVYGTFPTYILTFLTVLISKLGFVDNKNDIYISLRSISALISFAAAPVASYICYKVSNNHKAALATFALLLLNWKFIAMGHYVNADIILTLLLLTSFAFLLNGHTIPAAVLFGFAYGTKITALLSIPLIFIYLLKKKSLYDALAFCVISVGAFIITNPFSIIFFHDFALRMLELVTKEGGLVFDSVDQSLTKYISASSLITTLPLYILAIGAMIKSWRNSLEHKFLIANVLLYILFFSLQSRRVDRWLLPIIPIIVMYGAIELQRHWKKGLVGFMVLTWYLVFTISITRQFIDDTPRSRAYLWAKENLPVERFKLGYTEEGLDPLNKLPNMKMSQVGVYENEGGQLILPKDPMLYDFVFYADRPMENFKKNAVIEKYPHFAERWQTYEDTIFDPTKFKLIKSFETTTPNLLPLTNIYVYEKLK